MAVGSEPEIGIVFTTWGKMDEASKEAWLAYCRGLRERGNILEGYATVNYPKSRQKGKAKVSEGSNIELAHRDLGIEIEKLIEDRDRFRDDWKAMIKQIEDLEHQVKRLKRMVPNG